MKINDVTNVTAPRTGSVVCWLVERAEACSLVSHLRQKGRNAERRRHAVLI
jgi:hypothetical protein